MFVKQRLLIVEDDQNFGSVLKEYLGLHGFDVTLEADGLKGEAILKKERFDLCILDVMMPGMDGFTLATRIKEMGNNCPFIFLTAKGLKDDIIKGFRLGADDYILKPFDAELLLFKIKAVLNRARPVADSVAEKRSEYVIGSLVFYPHLRHLQKDGETITLSPKENALLELLCIYMNDVMPRELALKQIWDDDNYFTARSMDVYIARLRKYLRKDPSVEIVNLHQKGFRLYVKNELGVKGAI